MMNPTTGEGGAHQNRPEVDFHHPYTPYDVQDQFMKTVYDILEHGKGQVGILESPTGTGKSLSLICASLTWLRNHKRNQYEASIQTAAENFKGEPDWIVEQMLRQRREDLLRKWEEREQRLEKARAKEKRMEQRASKRRRLDETNPRIKNRDLDEEAEFLIDEEDELNDDDPLSGISKETRLLLEKVGLASSRRLTQEQEQETEDEIKIFYTSRTHSQLTQFISELRRPIFQSSVPTSTQNSDGKENKREDVKHLPLSSRQNLCINPSVSRLGSLSAINDRCAELQKPKSKDKCSFLPGTENLSQTHQFRDATLATLPDIEDMYDIGKSLQVCPYYASRSAIPSAEIITLPYPLLLMKNARDALGIKLEGNVVIIDEAHNIMSAVANVHAAEIRLSELRRGRQMLGVYVKRFGKKLKGQNRVMIGQVGRVMEGLSQWMDTALKTKGDHGIVDSSALLKHKGADQINLFDLIKYVQESKLAFKVESYATHLEEQEASTSQHSSTPVLHTLVSFLLALTNLSTEGRIFHEKLASSTPDIKLSYLLLSPTHAFSTIASSARAIILAGGTMSPFDDYKAHLFPSYPDDRITTLSCGHVIPSSNLCVWTLASTRPGQETQEDGFEFSFQKRNDRSMIRQLGQTILNICSVVPDGVVVFFPSYGYLDEMVTAWQKADEVKDGQKPVWDRLQTKKAVYRESKGGSSEEILQAYSNAILGEVDSKAKDGKSQPSQRGALLLSVVGGKMSEGINFSDRLGRCVVIVGLPYPNINSPEWKARLEYIESATLSLLTETSKIEGDDKDQISKVQPKEQAIASSKQAARSFYENACMRAVNQSIGRAIRHRGDYAAIVLADRRFGMERIRTKLPGWIRGGIVTGSEEKGLQGLMGALNGFFREKKVKQ